MPNDPMEFDLKAFLRRFGLLFYTGDREGDLLLIEDEIRELHKIGVIDDEEFKRALAALFREKRRM